ncbi:hypothetical protein BCR37DRAFT_170763 [Protomyces lactucae-debilis]|uniref:Uncharacterized protein n=1 Tax=Protomyces lactucae-debilis TaxID=2754530 RepID=A0A1Y2EW75_PROLT|nr:uncharacterized protein BCR37DRAFT_170763 [Protomyces lactucae-debilis]ORY75757.1 hypothetical protein BCR37DRAFT_170763 [Protomyces lactucae-debilis]
MLYTPSTHTSTATILQQAATRTLAQPTCCCLQQTCAAQQQNKQLMTLLEDELALAAQLGQRIILQHDEHVVKADQERRAVLLEIERQRGIQERAEALEQGNRLLERQNHSVMDENLSLMKRLEQLHAQLNHADSRNQDLLATLADAEQANDSLSSKALAAQTLKQQVSSIQLEKEALEQQVQSLAHDQEGSAARFRKAQRKIDELEETLQRLSQPATYIPHSIRPRTPTRQRSHSPATSTAPPKLVADLFEENATLASSAAELRRLLAASQEELAALRQEPITTLTHVARPHSPTLRQTISQELHHHHYHHYYHVPDKTGKKRSSSTRLRRLVSSETEYTTPAPVSRVVEHGLASPVSLQKQTAPTRRGPRDSGYFSVSRDRSSSYSHPSTPMDLPSTTDDESERDLARTPTRFKQRASSVHTSWHTQTYPSRYSKISWGNYSIQRHMNLYYPLASLQTSPT